MLGSENSIFISRICFRFRKLGRNVTDFFMHFHGTGNKFSKVIAAPAFHDLLKSRYDLACFEKKYECGNFMGARDHLQAVL